MDKKMTSGEIAKKAGVSQKAVRLYDEKGLLKPTDYSEGNYRLYDAGALQILEKIVALKQIGFSLEEIRDNLIAGDAKDIESALRLQLKAMEDKKYQIEKVIVAINRTLDRKTENLDWDDVAEIVQNVNLDQNADERHWDALKHTGQEMDWYEKIYESLNISENSNVLDLGCGYAKLWRNNWNKIPSGTKVYGYDIHGSWADDFEKYLAENKNALPKNVDVNLYFSDIEEDATWENIKKDGKYNLIIAHYVQYQLKNPEAMVAKASKLLAKNGVFSFNAEAVSTWLFFYRSAFEEMGLKTSFIDNQIADKTLAQNKCEEMLSQYFSENEKVFLSNTWHYSDSNELVERLLHMFPEQEKFIAAHSKQIQGYFDKKIENDGEIAVKIESLFWHCRK